MSPYIVIMCMERLSKTIQHAVELIMWNPIKIRSSGPSLSYLFFADDLTLFAKADAKNCSTIANILHQFWKDSGQKVKCTKSRIILLKNCISTIKDHAPAC